MKLLFFALFNLTLNFTLWGKSLEKEFIFNSFSEAQKAEDSYLSFEIKSTKMGLFTSTVPGFAKKFKFKSEYDEKNQVASTTEISFNVEDLDTDSSGRNEKMHETCLSKTKTPQITIKTAKVDIKNLENGSVDAVMNVRGVDKPIKLNLSVKSVDKNFVIEGTSQVKFSELEIPDPSIVIAKVNDVIDIKFKFDIPKE